MIKISYILNILVAIVALGILVMALLYGIRYFATSTENSFPSRELVQSNELTESVVNAVTLVESPIQPVEKTEPIAPAVPVAPPKLMVALYPNDRGDFSAFTTMENNSEIIVFDSKDEWTEVFSSHGLPVWVRGDMVKEYGNGYVEVVVASARTRNLPTTESTVVMGNLTQGEVLKVSRKKDGWFRVWSPIRFRAWAKTEELDR